MDKYTIHKETPIKNVNINILISTYLQAHCHDLTRGSWDVHGCDICYYERVLQMTSVAHRLVKYDQ